MFRQRPLLDKRHSETAFACAKFALHDAYSTEMLRFKLVRNAMQMTCKATSKTNFLVKCYCFHWAKRASSPIAEVGRWVDTLHSDRPKSVRVGQTADEAFACAASLRQVGRERAQVQPQIKVNFLSRCGSTVLCALSNVAQTPQSVCNCWSARMVLNMQVSTVSLADVTSGV